MIIGIIVVLEATPYIAKEGRVVNHGYTGPCKIQQHWANHGETHMRKYAAQGLS